MSADWISWLVVVSWVWLGLGVFAKFSPGFMIASQFCIVIWWLVIFFVVKFFGG